MKRYKFDYKINLGFGNSKGGEIYITVYENHTHYEDLTHSDSNTSNFLEPEIKNIIWNANREFDITLDDIFISGMEDAALVWGISS